MNLKKISFIFALIFIAFTSFSQDRISRPSPNNTLKTGSGDLVTHYTGELNFGIPLVSLTSKESQIPVALQYISGGGVRVQDYASMVGLGWRLVAGGKITRIVRGYPDEQDKGYLGTNQWGNKLKAAINANPTNPTYPTQLYAQVNSNSIDPEADGESDMYYIETPFFSTYFTFDESGEAVFLTSNGLKINQQNFLNTTNFDNSKFTVLDDSGNQFYFASNGSKEYSQFHTQKHYISSWYLDRIISASTRDTIDFEYNNFNSPTFFSGTYTETGNSALNAREKYNQYSGSKTYLTGTSYTPYYDNITRETRVRPLYLSTIKTNYGKVEFNYLQDRVDLNAPRLTSIILSNKVNNVYTPITTYQFEHSYFGNGTVNNEISQRLCLDRIKYFGKGETASKARTSYTFNYNRRINLPDRNSNQYDYFGFFTNTNTTTFSNTVNPLDNNNSREPVFLDYASANILEGYENQLGESVKIKYELKTTEGYNIYGGEHNYQYANGVRVNEISKSGSGGFYKTTFQYDFDNISSGRLLDKSFKSIVLTAPYASGYTWYKTVSHSESNLFDNLSPIVGYSKVKQINTDGSSIIKEFMNYNDYPDLLFRDGNIITYGGGARVLSSISKAQKRGMLKKETFLNSAGNTIKTIDYTYASQGSIAKKAYSLKSYATTFRVGNNSTITGIYLDRTLYWNETENYNLIETKEKIYDSSLSNSIQTSQEYVYLPNYWQVRSILTKNADGSSSKVTSYYPSDGNNIPTVESQEVSYLNALVASNVLSPLVHQVTEKNDIKVSAKHSYLDQQVRLLEESAYGFENGVEKKLSTSLFAYKNGNISVIQQTNGVPESFGYRGDVQDVKITNAWAQNVGSSTNKYYEFYYEGFEGASTTNKYTGIGSKATPFTVPFVKPNTKNFFIDYRYLDASGKWLYKKETYSNNMILNIGSAVDEIRVYPEGSFITTSTHEPLIGITSESNSRGQTMFYEYDSLNRLITVKDQEGNILKNYQYSF